MGNSCKGCNNKEEEQNHQEIGTDNTPRKQKPESLPSISQAIKNQNKIVKKEREQHIVEICEQNNQLPADNNCGFCITNKNLNPQNDLQQRFSKEVRNKTTDKKLPIEQSGNASNPSNLNVSQKANQQEQIQKMISVEEEKSVDPKNITLYEKLGGDEGVKIFIDKIFKKIFEDDSLKSFFENSNIELVKEKFRQYVSYLSGGQQHWIGKSIKDSHKELYISDDLFDKFIGYTVASLKEMKVKHDCLKETVRVLQGLREEIVKKTDFKNTLYNQLGKIEGITKLTDIVYRKVRLDPIIASFFIKTNQDLIKKKFVYLLTHLTGGPYEWIGKSMQEAHAGMNIKDTHFVQFLCHVVQSMDDLQIEKDAQNKLIDLLTTLKKDIIQQAPRSLFLQLDKNDKFESMMHSFIQKLMKCEQTFRLFKNVGSMNTLVSKFALHFACKAGYQYQVDGPSLHEIHRGKGITQADFDQASILFLEVLDEQKIYEDIKDEAFQLFLKLREDLVDDFPPISQNNNNEQKQDNFQIKCEEQRSGSEQEDLRFNLQMIQSSYDHQSRVFKEETKPQQSEQPKEEEQKIEEVQEIQQNNEVQQQMQVSQDQQKLHTPQQSQRERPQEIEIIKNQNGISPSISPIYKKYHREFKYALYDLLGEINPQSLKDTPQEKCTPILEGELQRFMEKQKTQLPRWLILKQKALFIYKDQLNSKSFPTKPLYAIPISEIKSVTVKETLLYPNQRKSQAIHSIELELSENYGIIAESIAQLVSVYALNKKDPTLQHSPLKERKSNKQKKNEQSNHSYEDKVLIFVSNNKKDINKWARLLKEMIDVPQGKVIEEKIEIDKNEQLQDPVNEEESEEKKTSQLNEI